MSFENSVDLLREAREGSPEAMDALFERCGRRLLPLIRLRMGPGLRSRCEFGDILQASLLRAYERLDQFRGEGGSSIMAWLARIAENEIRDEADRQGRQRRDVRREVPLAVDPVLESVRSAVSRVAFSEEAARLETELESLSEEHREVILLRRFEEMPFPQIGERIGKTADASRMLFARAMAALTVRMGGEP